MFLRWFGLFGIASLLLTACERKSSEQALAPAIGLYGEPEGTPSARIAKLTPARANANEWQKAAFACVQTELSPATLYHSTSKYLGLFMGMTNSGLGTPSHIAFGTIAGPKIFKNGTNIQADLLQECWILAWFEGAAGWTNWDSPWAVFLQHRPTNITLNAGGLHFEFASQAGDVVLMPLYGYYKLPLRSNDYLASHGLPSKKLKSWEWKEAVSKDPLMRVRYWASAMREFPLYCEDTFSVDRSRDTVTIRQKFTFHSIRDDWKTQPLKLAPVSPPLGHASLEKAFPARFSKPPVNLEVFTPCGPYLAVENVDSYDVSFPVLKYINETEASDSPATNSHPGALAALEKLRETARHNFQHSAQEPHDRGGLTNLQTAIQDRQWLAKTLPYMDSQTRSNAVVNLRKYFRDELLVANRFNPREYPEGSGREYLVLEGADAGVGPSLLETIWAYAHFTGDWELIRERWPLIKRLFITPAETRWAGFGRGAAAVLADEAPPCIAMARLAYKAGDLDAYNYACSMFARELAHHFLKQKGAELFRKNQPYHSMEFMDAEVYLTSLRPGAAGWQIDGPNYPAQAAERQFDQRWARFADADTARFYRDCLPNEVRAELDRLQQRWDSKRQHPHALHGTPSLVRLRSVLLNEPPAELVRVAEPEQFTGAPLAILADCWAVIRTSHPVRYERLIPAGPASPFVTGLERDVPGPNPELVQTILGRSEGATQGQPAWPLTSWWKSWRTPTGARWNFGQVTPSPAAQPAAVKESAVSWNTRALIYEMP